MVRQEAVQHFTYSFSRDAEVMPVAVRAIETYGRDNAFPRVGTLQLLAQSPATVDWAIKELHREANAAEHPEDYFAGLSQIFCSADLNLVAPRTEEILQAPRFSQDLAPALRERLELASWDTDRCWEELEHISAEALATGDSSDVDFDHADRVVEALARKGDRYVD